MQGFRYQVMPTPSGKFVIIDMTTHDAVEDSNGLTRVWAKRLHAEEEATRLNTIAV